MSDLADVIAVYTGSDGARTAALYAELEALGPIGIIAVNLFRAQKASERAKVYRGGGFRGKAYDKKQWSMDNAAKALREHAGAAGIGWGWGLDLKQPVHRHVLYIDLPTGQVSFHSGARGAGPDYPGEWDGRPGQSADRVCRWVARLVGAREPLL